MFLFGRPGQCSSMRWLGLSASIGASLAICCGSAAARNTQVAADVSLSQLPAEAQTTHRLIIAGGPFPYPKDGIVFANRERALPPEPRGFYREYTVKTPRASNRGARRIVCGGRIAQQPEACYYTADHYASFRRIAP